MTHVYARARITPSTSFRRVHWLPRGSTPRVLENQIVKAADPLAIAEVAGEHRIVDIAAALGVAPEQVEPLLVKRPGERIMVGDVLAQKPGFLGFRMRQVESPIDGRVIVVEDGKMLLEGKRIRTVVEATVPGRVISVDPESRIVVETTGAAVDLAWGQGGLSWGTLKVMDSAPGLETEAGRFNIDHRGAIVVIGSPLTEEFLRGAIEIRVKGLIAASLPASLLPLLNDAEFPVGVTQGFGRMAMSRTIFDLLSQHNGREVVLDTGESSDWRDRRPEIIIPLASQRRESVRDVRERRPLAAGQRVRVLQAPHTGKIGTVTSVPPEPRRLPSGVWAPGAVVEIEDMEPGKGVFVAFANLEQLD